MIKRIALLLLIITSAFAQIQYKAGDNPYIIKVGSNEKYHTIQSAIDVWQLGYIIKLSPENFNESVIISDSGLVIIGSGKQTILKDILIESPDITIEDLSFRNIKTTCSTVYAGFYPTQIKSCDISGSISTGDSSTSDSYKTLFRNCNIFSNGYIFINSTTINTATEIIDSRQDVLGYEGDIGIDIYLKSGLLEYHKCDLVVIDTLKWDVGNTAAAYIDFHQCRTFIYSLLPSGVINFLNTFSFQDGKLVLSGTETITFDGKFELILFHSRVYFPDIVYDSSVGSRWDYVEQLDYESTSTLTGTANLSNLHVRNSTFHCAEPVGLNDDSGNNLWAVWIDN